MNPGAQIRSSCSKCCKPFSAVLECFECMALWFAPSCRQTRSNETAIPRLELLVFNCHTNTCEFYVESVLSGAATYADVSELTTHEDHP